MDKNARIRIGIATLLIAALVTTLALHFTAAQSPSVSSGYTIDGNSVHWELENKGRITVSPHTSHGRWDAMRYQTIEFESYFGTVEEVTCGLAFNERPVEYGLSLQKEHVVQYPQYNPVTNETLGYKNVTESYWQDVTSQLTTGNRDSKFFGYGTFTIPAIGKKIFQARYILNESDPIVDGKRKWEMRCWQGSFTSPTWEINLDPWADGLTCAAYYNFDNNQTNTTHAQNWQNCTLGDAKIYGATTGQTGKLGEAYYEDGSVSYVASMDLTGITGAADRTIGGWFNISPIGIYNTFIFGHGTFSTNTEFTVLAGGDTTNWHVRWGSDGTCASPAILYFNDWVFLVAVLNESGTKITMYQNGTKIMNCTVSALNTANSPFYLGNRTRETNWVDFKGQMDEPFMFATAMTDDQIMAMYVDGTKSLWSAPSGSANESAGRTAIAAGISASSASSGTTYTDRKVYIRYLNGTQKLGTFDKVLSEGNQRWLFNYNTTGENYTNMANLAPTIYVWENTSLTSSQITAQVSGFINATNT